MLCKLCGADKELCNSHIIPEFFYKNIYDPKHRLMVITNNERYKKSSFPKGIYEKLLCSKCETFINEFESYASEIFYAKHELDIGLDDSKDPIIVSKINYNKFKLFLLSIIWRASISSHEAFSGIKLGPHEESIRQMILNTAPGKSFEYGCIPAIFALEDGKSTGEIIGNVTNFKSGGHRFYSLLFGGLFWIYCISSHGKQYELSRYFLNEEGQFFIFKDLNGKARDLILNRILEIKNSE